MPITIEDTFGEVVQAGERDDNTRDRGDFFEEDHRARWPRLFTPVLAREQRPHLLPSLGA
jgi:hypothetical protein